MNRNERATSEEEVLRLALRGLQARMWTALPGIIEKFDAARMVVDVQPAINGCAPQLDGSTVPIQMPKLLDCPVVWQGGGGATITFPIKAGDECLVVFSSRRIDDWWAQGGTQDPLEVRMHNLSDGFALVGLRCLPRAFAVDTTFAMLRADDGATFVKLDPEGQLVTVTAPGGITLNGVTIDSSGNLHSPAKISAPNIETDSGKKLGTHKHTETGSITQGPDNS